MADYSPLDAFQHDIARSQPTQQSTRALGKVARIGNLTPGEPAALDQSHELLVYISSGATKLIACASGGREQIVAFHFRGDLVSIPASAWHEYSLSALVGSQIIAFNRHDFVEATNSDPAFANIVMERALTALHRCRDNAVGLGRKSASERLASFLIGMAERIGVYEDQTCVLDLPMSRKDIGDSLGLTIETVSRQLGHLRDQALVQTEGRSLVRLLEPVLLAERAGHV